ncbi:15849_t:CDS:2, partial [Acaulospora morrowiae]
MNSLPHCPLMKTIHTTPNPKCPVDFRLFPGMATKLTFNSQDNRDVLYVIFSRLIELFENLVSRETIEDGFVLESKDKLVACLLKGLVAV